MCYISYVRYRLKEYNSFLLVKRKILMKIVNSICQAMEKYESICKSKNLLFHFLEWVQINMERLPVILNGTALHILEITRLEMWVSRINEKTGKHFCNERSDEFQTRRKKIKTLLIIEHKK